MHVCERWLRSPLRWTLGDVSFTKILLIISRKKRFPPFLGQPPRTETLSVTLRRLGVTPTVEALVGWQLVLHHNRTEAKLIRVYWGKNDGYSSRCIIYSSVLLMKKTRFFACT